ncbi:DUF4184 family protein [Morganella morganii]
MPWTFAHPAVVFPLKHSRFGRWLNLPALITGSVSPDLLYSFGMYRAADKAHHFTGWFYTGLPVCLAVLFIFHCLSAPLKTVLPFPVTDPLTRSLRKNTIIVLSLFIGAATHIVWDAFTHETGTMVRALSVLQVPLLHGMTDGQEIAVYKVLQHLGSLLGSGYLCLKFAQYQRALPEAEKRGNLIRLIRLIALAVLAALCTAPLACRLAQTTAGVHINRFVFYELSLSVSFFAAFVVLAALFQVIRKH